MRAFIADGAAEREVQELDMQINKVEWCSMSMQCVVLVHT
jgi:hypothetical protein